VDGFKAYKYYMAVKLHFTTDKYDVFENKGQVKGSRDVFSNRNDHYMFEKLARKFVKDFDIIQYYVANFAYGNDAVIYSDADAMENWVTWQKRKQSITQMFKHDIEFMILQVEKENLSPEEVFKFVQGDHPKLLKWFLGGKVCIETMCILDHFENYLQDWKSNANLLLEEECRRIIKCKGFVKFDTEKLAPIHQQLTEELLPF